MTDITVEIRNGEQTAQGLRFRPGEQLSGTVHIIPSANLNCRHVWARLEWHTEGRGDRDVGRVAEIDLYNGRLGAGVPAYYDFSVILPDSPWSYSGHYINIIWRVVASIDLRMKRDPQGEARFILAPEGH
jgi:hypothetical protein